MTEPKRLWLDLGQLGGLTGDFGISVDLHWHDHGLALLRTILKDGGIETDLASLRAVRTKQEIYPALVDADVLLMNVRSYTMTYAVEWAKTFKEINPAGKVIVGGMHVDVAPEEFEREPAFDHVCKGPGEGIIVDLVKNPGDFPRMFDGPPSPTMATWPYLDRTMWPKGPPGSPQSETWPLEQTCGLTSSPPVATLITSRVCPFHCSFCNEASYIANMGRRPVDQVIDELNYVDKKHGPIGSVVFHDSLFFQNMGWLKEFLDKYPRLARRPWPYWAATRADLVRKFPDLFEALVRETHWEMVSIGFESGSDRMLKVLNKECTVEDNAFSIDLVNRIGDDLENQGRRGTRFWANLMFALPGETKEDAMDTVRMLRSMKRAFPSIAYYTPYPGTALGYQLIAEGKSLIHDGDHNRYAGERKVSGLNYEWYAGLLRGDFDAEVRRKSWP